ncbi:ATP-binding cassette domain-containing protein [Bosea sp. FBZP-16]|nr:ATP-binding cassette domain-containing protein [Bosea sp. FBZP-16]
MNFQLAAGARLDIVGRNGAGKTTLLTLTAAGLDEQALRRAGDALTPGIG